MYNDDSTETSIIDFLFLLLIFILIMFIAAIPLINPIAQNKNYDAKGDFVIQMDWHENSKSDFDLWVKDPNGNIVSYRNKSSGLMFLDIDDLGETTDCIILPSGEAECIKLNREIVTLRGVLDGEYTVNVFFFSKKDDFPETKITVSLIRINPTYKLITKSEEIFVEKGEEKTLFNFNIKDKVNVFNINNMQKNFVLKHMEVFE